MSLRAGPHERVLCSFKSGQWQNLQLTLDLKSRKVSGAVGQPGDVARFEDVPLSSEWNGRIDFLNFESEGPFDRARPAIALDNLAVQ